MIEEGREVLELRERADQFLQVIEPSRRGGRAVLLPHPGVAGFVQQPGDHVRVRCRGKRAPPGAELADQLAERTAGPRPQLVALDQPLRRSIEGDVCRARELVNGAERGLAQPPLRQVHDTLEGEVVVGADRDADIGHGVPDLLTFVEAQAPEHPIGQADGQEAFLEGESLEAGAHQDGDAVEALALALQRLDFLAHNPRLFLPVPGFGDADLLALRPLGPEGLAEPPFVVGDEAGGGGEDVSGGAVVALQPDHLRAGKVLLEAEDVADLGAAPAVDRLVVVADAADAAVRLRQQPEPEVLGDVGVLVLVHQQIAETLLVALEHVPVAGEEGEVVQQQVAEVGGVHGAQPLLIGGVEGRRASVGEVRAVGARDLVGSQPPVLPALDDDREGARRPALLVDVLGPKELLEQADLVVAVEDGEVGLEACELGMAAQDAGGDGVEGAEPEAGGGAPDQLLDAADHLARRLVGEGDRQHLAGPGAAGGENVGEAGGEHAGLAGAGAGQHQQRPVQRFRRLALLRVQPVQIGAHGRRRRRRPGVLLSGWAERVFGGIVHGPGRRRSRAL